MNSLGFGRYAFSICVSVAMFTGCSSGSGTSLSPSPAGLSAERARPSVTYGVLYSFKGGSGDGADPYAGVISVNGTLYGTTYSGGASGDGTVFAVTKTGNETVLYSFKGGSSDGTQVVGGLLNVKGMLYGTTRSGGANGGGTVFSITPSGTETVLHSFGASGDGAGPAAGLIKVRGTLCGTTAYGGANGDGTVFSITPSGTETVLYSFKGGSEDGAYPEAGLINVKGTLYGTTVNGGANCWVRPETEPSLRSLGPARKACSTVSAARATANYPYAGVISVKDRLYGTTLEGGANSDGAVFKIARSGKETVLHSFGGSGDGDSPLAGVISVKNTLYGTTYSGGANNLGTVFSITPSGAETVLYSFKGGSEDGNYPYAALINVMGTLYGTTYSGGANASGTVFTLTR